MSKQKRTQAKIDCENRYKEKHKRVHLVFNADKPEDVELLNWLMDEAEGNSSKIPATIKLKLQTIAARNKANTGEKS